ncbi:hypothetical protein G4G28_14380 [Massilia sp. Dwa41.01b]|uniref:hypothetical protein n=1 Tax=unclassified Massilia TaxID=2609279 RepID=UPI0016007B10|nr:MULTISPECIES: hypothetical protein [unclassified Massilia]QNA89366.1 hypothetical protein G4G28_14380 [Massilia sp. Dwa41.01b]QNB00261.1 hypothetical protein G4G31_17950 [Massilia sp. Se16.2.3]
MKPSTLLFAASLSLVSAHGFCQAPLVPQARLAECTDSALEFARRTHGVTLDFSPRSLGYVDGMMNDFHTRKFPLEKVEALVRVMGCYAGEVFIRNLDGKWTYPAPGDVEKLGTGPFVALPKGVVINPIVKVQRIYEDGLEHSVGKFYPVVEAAVGQPAAGTKALKASKEGGP